MGSEKLARFTWVRMSIRFLSRSLTLRASSFLLALLAVTVGAGVAATMLNLKADLRAKMSRELRRYGPNLMITPAPDAVSPTLDEAAVRALAPGQVAPLLIATGTVAAAAQGSWADGAARTRTRAAATVVGTDFETLRRVNPSWRVKGTWPAGPDRASCLVGVSLARRAALAPGGRMTLEVAGGTATLEITGIVSTGESEDEEVFIPLALLQNRTQRTGRVSLAALSVEGGPEAVRREAAAIRKALPGASARPLRPVAAAQGAILSRLDRMMAALTGVVLLLSGLCLTTTLMSIVVEREEEIGLMRSIGAGDGDLLTMFLGEVTLLGLLGGLFGLLLGVAGARVIGSRLFEATIEARGDVAPLVLGVALALCWAAVLVPLRHALAVQPAAALRGE